MLTQAAEQTMLSMKEFNENYKDKTLEVDLDKILQDNPETFVIDGEHIQRDEGECLGGSLPRLQPTSSSGQAVPPNGSRRLHVTSFLTTKPHSEGADAPDAKKKGMVSWLGYNTTDGDGMRSSDPPLAQVLWLGS